MGWVRSTTGLGVAGLPFGPLETNRSQGVVPVCYLARMAFGAMASLYLFWTAAILILYRRGG